MFKDNCILFFLGLMEVCLGSPILQPHPPTKAAGYYPSSAISPSGHSLCRVKFEGNVLRSGVKKELRWQDGFYVHPDPAFTESELQVINDALYELENVLCIPVRIWPQDSIPTGDFVEIMRGGPGTGCFADVGKRGGKQMMNLEPQGLNSGGCIYKNTVQHELIHALGYYHEQSRPDRDDYIDIFYENIQQENAYNFAKYSDSETFGTRYDSHSIMHYASDAFSSNGRYTILAKDGSLVGSKSGNLTANDVEKLRKLYNCSLA